MDITAIKDDICHYAKQLCDSGAYGDYSVLVNREIFKKLKELCAELDQEEENQENYLYSQGDQVYDLRSPFA